VSASTNREDVYRTQTARFAELEAENAALRKALEDILMETDEQVIYQVARAALIREEQP